MKDQMTVNQSKSLAIRSNAVLISEEDWRTIKETLSLMSIPGMRESIIKGMKEPVEKFTFKSL